MTANRSTDRIFSILVGNNVGAIAQDCSHKRNEDLTESEAWGLFLNKSRGTEHVVLLRNGRQVAETKY